MAFVHKELALSISHTTADKTAARVAHEPLGRLFLRFLKFASLAWGGPVSQIAEVGLDPRRKLCMK
ncbi:MAG: hypothetical protein QOK44_4302 [Betaproteobacteria bacterium]|jgi:hypothetical protein|nr:hypothetical protein [Betaproteobacteria bacterium]